MSGNQLDSIAGHYTGNQNHANTWRLIKENELKKLLQFMAKRGDILEIGLGNGFFTGMLAQSFQKVIAVDASQKVIELVKRNNLGLPNIEYRNSLVEDLSLPEPVDNIILGHLLEHLPEPAAALRRLRKLMKAESIIYITVPNAMSLHRQAGVKMGLLASVDEPNENDLKFGHLRFYRPESFLEEIRGAGFQILKHGGTMVKPLTYQQMDASWTKEMIEAYIALGDDYPELSGDLYAFATI